MFNLKRKVLFGVSVSMVLAMAIGSFALGESQTPASPRAVEVQSLVGATAGPFTVEGGTQGTDFDYASSVLTIHSGNLTISTTAQTSERIIVDGAATITLAGVNISTGSGPALQIQDNATFDVNILLADGSTNILKATASYYGSLKKWGAGDNIGTLTIGVPDGSQGTGKLKAKGGAYGAGIGGSGQTGSISNITINGGEVTATGGMRGAGIGGSGGQSASNITINGGVVTANGGEDAAGIGGGGGGVSNITINGGEVTATGNSNGAGIGGGPGWGQIGANNITITGGVVTATGGSSGGAGIGGGSRGGGSNITISGGVVTATGGSSGGAGIGGGSDASVSGSGNSLNGDAVVLATSGITTKAALEGFVDAQQQSLLTQGIAFTRQTTSGTWSGVMYGNVTLSQDLEIPANLTVPAGQILSIKEDKDVTLFEETGAKYTVEGELRNNGIVTLPDDLVYSDNGKVTTKTDFYLEGSTDVYTTGYQTYKTSAGVQKYTNLPNPDNSNDTVFDSWFTKPGGPSGGGTKVDGTIDVLLNEHSFYEHRVVAEYTITVAEFENGSITPDVTEAAKDDTVTLTVTPDEGYQLKEGSLIVTDADGNEVPVTEENGKYTFTMPDSEVEISAEFELIPEPEPIPDPSVDPDQGGDGSDASSKTGDSFTGMAALAILGVATTGTVLLRKRK